jgi:hypothetical protein
MDNNSVFDTTAKAHDAILDYANIAGAVPAALNEAGGRGIDVVVVAHKEHRSANLKLAALSVGAKGGAICGVNDAHLATIYGSSKIQELMNRFRCEDINRVVNASSAAETPLVVIPIRLNKPYQVSVIPNPAEMTNDTAEGFLLSSFMVEANARAVLETTASPPLLMRLIEDRSKAPNKSLRFSKSRVSLESRKFGAKASSID